MPFPSLPSSLTFENTPELLDLKEKLDKGDISLEETEVAIAAILESIENEKEVFSSALEFSSIKEETNNPFFSICEVDNENAHLSHMSDDDNLTEAMRSDNNDLTGEDRLLRVEQILQTVMNQMNGPTTFAQTRNTPIIRAPPIRPSHGNSATSMVSALSTSDYIVDEGIAKESDTKEKDELRKEIEDLKRQLAYAQKQPTYALSLDDTTSTSTNIDKKMKKKKRKLLKKPWKKDADNRKKE